MLSKKQYRVTLLTAVIVFFVLLVVNTWYFSQHGLRDGRSAAKLEKTEEKLQPATETVLTDEVTILPQTKITIKVEDLTTKKEEKTTVDAASLLGLNKEQLQERFDDYTVETFNEKEVCLKKEIASKVQPLRDISYVLGVDGDNVCIKEKDSNARPVKIDYNINHLSSYTYSILLNEEIEITQKQKEALLLNPSTLQRILQEYVGE